MSFWSLYRYCRFTGLPWRAAIGRAYRLRMEFPLHLATDVERAMEAEIADLRAAVFFDIHTAPEFRSLDNLSGAAVRDAGMPKTLGDLFASVGGWMNGGELGYPSFGSMDALMIFTKRSIRAALAAAPLPQVQSEAIPDLYIGKWSISADEENFSGEHNSEKEAIAEATALGYAKFWIGQCVHPVETLPDAQSIGESVIQQADEWAYEKCGGDDRIFDLNDDDTTNLGRLVRDFIKREASVQRYDVTNIMLHQPAEDQQPVTPSGALADNDGGVA